MAVEEGRFFTGSISDQRFRADGIAEYFRPFVQSGVKSLGTNLQVTAPGTGMVINVDYGDAMVEGFGYWLRDNGKGRMQLSIAAANTQPRIDRVVLRLDKSADTENLKLAVKQGTPAASPSPPALIQTGNVYERSLAQVQVDAGVSAIAAGKVTDERSDPSVCGLYNLRVTEQIIPSGADLNSYIAPGIYYCPLNATVQTLINCPTDVAFTLEVLQNGDAITTQRRVHDIQFWYW